MTCRRRSRWVPSPSTVGGHTAVFCVAALKRGDPAPRHLSGMQQLLRELIEGKWSDFD